MAPAENVKAAMTLKESPLSQACDALQGEITGLQEELDMLFGNLQPVLAPESPTDGVGLAEQAQPPRSVHVEFVEGQASRVAGIRHRLAYLRARLEV